MIKKIVSFSLAGALMLSLSGCSFKSDEVNIPETQIMSDKEKGYIIFSRPSKYLGGAINIDLFEFDKKTFEPKVVGTLSSGERTIYKVDEGEHYFFMEPTEYIQVVNVKKGEIKYINIFIDFMYGFVPMELSEQRIDLKNNILKEKCTDKTLDKYMFNKSYTSPLKLSMKCEDERIIELNETYLPFNSLKDFNSTNLVQPNKYAFSELEMEKDVIQGNIKGFFPIWESKLKLIPYSEELFLTINKVIDDSNFQKFQAVKIERGTHDEKVDKKLVKDFFDEFSKRMGDKNSGENVVTAKISFNKYDDGNMAMRYLVTGLSKNILFNNIGIIDFTVDFYNKDEKISSIKLSETEIGGVFGGINTLKIDTLKILEEYIQRNLIKK